MMKFFGFGSSKKKDSTPKEEAPQKTVSQSSVSKGERKRDDMRNVVFESPRLGNVPKQSEGEQIAAGWPEWLTTVAGEALKGWLPRRASSFEKIDKIGQGTYSNVYKARDLVSGQVVALKKVRFDKLEPESVRFMAREIIILRRLDHPNVVKLEGLVTSRMSCSLYLVFQYLDHDLASITSTPNIIFTEEQVKCYLLQILRGLDHCHYRGVLHRDIKGSNLLLDTEGNLKIADFGLATFFKPNSKQQLTTRVVTLWYRPPELLLGATEYGTGVDIWSVGCILGELFAGKPILPGRTEVEQLHKIFKLCGSPPEEYWKKYKLSHAAIFKPQHPYKRMLTETYKHFSQTALELLDVMLAIDPDDRGSASSALKSDFFNTKPFACEPWSLPKYVPHKADGKGQDEKGRRQRVADANTQELDSSKVKSIPRNPSNAPHHDIKAENNDGLVVPITQSARSKSERFFVKAKDLTMKLPIDASRQPQQEGGRNRVYALPPDPFQPEPALQDNLSWARLLEKKPQEEGLKGNLSWAELLDRKPREEGFNAVRTRPPLSRSVRHTTVPDLPLQGTRHTTAPDLSSQGSYEIKQPGSGLSKLSTLVATRNSRGQEFCPEGLEERSNERFHDEKKSQEVSTNFLRPSRLNRGQDGFDLQEEVHQKRSKIPELSGAAQRMHYSGPLLPQMANVEHIMQEHDQQIRKAFRRRHERERSQQKGELQVFGGRGVNESLRGVGHRESYNVPLMANSSRVKYRSSKNGEINKTKKAADAEYETYEFQNELQYL